jgi:hemolysin activation/secretion protein
MIGIEEISGQRRLRAVLSCGCAVIANLAVLGGGPALAGPAPAEQASGQETPSANSAAAPSPKPERHFDINAFDVLGNTVLDEEALDRALEPFLGPDRAMTDIEAARKALETAYASRGFQTVYVTIPKQTVKGGLVKLQVVENKIGNVEIKGQAHTSPAQVQNDLPSLKPGTVPDLNRLNGELVTLNSKSRDLQVTPQMKEGKEHGTIDVDLAVEDKLALHGGAEINNRYSRDTRQYRVQANASYDNLWGLNHSITGFYSVAPENRDDGEVYTLAYSAPVPGSDLRLSLTGLRSNSNISTLGSTDVLGKGWSVTLAATLPLGSVGSYFHYLQGSVAYKHFNDTVTLCTTGGSSTACSSAATQITSAPITYYPFSLTYVGSWQDSKNQVSANAGLNFSFRGLGSSQTAFDTSRYLADGDFVYAKGALSWLHNLPYGFDAYSELGGQIANGPLISNEQFSIGGDGSVRGYLQSEGLGDQGFRGSLELRSPSLSPYFHVPALNEVKLVTFLDGAKAWLHSPLPDQQSDYSLMSTGVGITAGAFNHLHGSLYLAYPLKATVDKGMSGVTAYGQQRFQFRVWTEF